MRMIHCGILVMGMMVSMSNTLLAQNNGPLGKVMNVWDSEIIFLWSENPTGGTNVTLPMPPIFCNARQPAST